MGVAKKCSLSRGAALRILLDDLGEIALWPEKITFRGEWVEGVATTIIDLLTGFIWLTSQKSEMGDKTET